MMPRIRLSIATLLAGIALFGVAFTALIHPSPLWGNAAYSMTLATLTIAVLAAIYGRGPRRAFRVGFSTCGWVYFLAIFGPEPLSNFGSNLVTTAILDIFYPYTTPRIGGGAALTPARQLYDEVVDDGSIILAGAFGGGPAVPPPVRETLMAQRVRAGAFGGVPAVPPPTPWEIWTKPDRTTRFKQSSPLIYRQIGHSMFCLIFALIGGVLTRRFQQARRIEETSQGLPPLSSGL
jgi:hypothetical protein